MSNTNKTHPTHKVWFSDKHARPDSRNGIAAGVVWPRKVDKQGGIYKWTVSPEILGEGAFRLLENRLSSPSPEGTANKTYTLSFAQKQGDAESLGRAIKVASVDEDGLIDWLITPAKLGNGVLFVLEDKPEPQAETVERSLGNFNTDSKISAS